MHLEILVTGCAGFIGFHLCQKLISSGFSIVGVDNLSEYYNVELKQNRLKILKTQKNFVNYQLDIQDFHRLKSVINSHNISKIVNLAAQAGVRYSIKNPKAYIDNNIRGFFNVIEACRSEKIQHLIYASSSSVYGLNTKMPFSTVDRTDHPISLYAATKKSNELIAHSYSHLYGIPTTGIRFFTVYGPWGRPDMAYYLFAQKIMNDQPIRLFNRGKMRRDFTYISDIIEGIFLVMNKPPEIKPKWNGNPSESSAPYKIYNIGNSNPVELLYLINVLEKTLGKKAAKEFLPMQPGDVHQTYADVDDLVIDVGFKPSTTIDQGVTEFAEWFKWYHN